MRTKSILLIIIIILSLLSTGCQTNDKYEFAQTMDNMKKVEIINVENGEEKVLIELDSFDIISDIQELSFKKYWNDPCQVINGLAVMTAVMRLLRGNVMYFVKTKFVTMVGSILIWMLILKLLKHI